MLLDVGKARECLTVFDLGLLFIEILGWNRYDAKIGVTIDGERYTLSAIAEKCGMAAFICDPGGGGRLPDYPRRRRIERQVAKTIHEHLIIFVDEQRTLQVWQWVRRQPGKPAVCREHRYHTGQPGDSLIQKLQVLAVSLEEEEGLTITDVTDRSRIAFDVERVTKRFYDRFKTEHAGFLKFLEGIPDEELERGYVSVMLDRLMFIYFIQKKGFLNDDQDYLKNKLVQGKKDLGKDRYYKDFLCPLFFEGFAKRTEERSREARALLGDVPYLNGGIFTPHRIEQMYGKAIAIADRAFEDLFAFFDAYRWHLDERPLRQDNEINPDVLGYIFEKYVNQKQMGAYYSKEDITGHISRNTVIPFLLDAARGERNVAFESERPVWQLLREDPDRYVYPAVRHGAKLPLPEDVAAGLADVGKRGEWNRPAPASYALPTEIWREVVARRKRFKELRGKLASGEVCSINDLITYNLDIRQFAQDVVETVEGPELLVAFWKAIQSVKVLDPTCGSGAFIFAALNILEPLYEGCLERMKLFLEEWSERAKTNHPTYYRLFTEALKRVEQHPNHRYFVLKSIIVNNLYGVDIMEEAVEICKLRLFLKLVAQIQRVEDLEPLPDIDFNIRAGNTLVGFISLDEVKKTQEGTLGFGKNEVMRIEEEAEIADRAFRKFREMQTNQGMKPGDFVEAKESLHGRLKKLTDELDRFMAGEYGVDPRKKDAFEKWRKPHQPFHWFAEFYGILKSGGFDVIIGNPPYVELPDVTGHYDIRALTLKATGNLYALCVERFSSLLRDSGRCGVIVPLSMVSTPRMFPLMQLIEATFNPVHLSHFAVRPGKLFVGVDMNLTILIGQVARESRERTMWSTGYNRWAREARAVLFATLAYCPTELCTDLLCIPKLGRPEEVTLFRQILKNKPISRYLGSNEGEEIYYHSGGRYFRKCLRRPLSNEYKRLVVPEGMGSAVLCLLTSSLYYWFWIVISDCYHVTKRDVSSLPVPDSLRQDTCFGHLAETLLQDLEANATMRVRARANGTEQVEMNFRVGRSKPLIDKIDTRLASHYLLTAEQVDFEINYDAKYRVRDDDE